MTINLYFSKRKDSYYYYGEPAICCHCNKPIEQVVAFLKIDDEDVLFSCYSHISHLKTRLGSNKRFKSCIFNVANITDELPQDAHPILFTDRVQLSRRCSAIDAATMVHPDCKVIDKTVYALKESFEGVQIGKPMAREEIEAESVEELRQIESKKSPETEEDLDAFFADVQNSVPVAFDGKKELEHKEDKNDS